MFRLLNARLCRSDGGIRHDETVLKNDLICVEGGLTLLKCRVAGPCTFDMDAWYSSTSEDFLFMFTTLAQGLPAGALHPFISTMTFTATVGPTSSLTMSKDTMARMQQLDDPYFTTIEESAFCPNVIQLASAHSTVKVKLFNKGAVQLTGCTSHVECMHTLGEVCRLIQSLCGGQMVTVLDISLRLINLNASVIPLGSGNVHLERLAQVARAPPHNLLAERPERPASCILHMDGNGKVMIYSTGRFSIHAKSPKDVAHAFCRLMNIMHTDPRSIVLPPKASRRHQTTGKVTWYDVLAYAMPGLVHTHPPTTEKSVHGCLYCALHGNDFAST